MSSLQFPQPTGGADERGISALVVPEIHVSYWVQYYVLLCIHQFLLIYHYYSLPPPCSQCAWRPGSTLVGGRSRQRRPASAEKRNGLARNHNESVEMFLALGECCSGEVAPQWVGGPEEEVPEV